MSMENVNAIRDGKEGNAACGMMNARCQIVVDVDTAKMGNAFVCKVSQGNSVNKVINTYEEPNLERIEKIFTNYSNLI